MERLDGIAKKLALKDGGHNKFLEAMQVWIEITAPRYWWQEFDTYRVGTTKQSESTIHTLVKKIVTQGNFSYHILPEMIDYLNDLIFRYNKVKVGAERKELFKAIKANLPEGYLQKRMVSTNYKVLRNMIMQRKSHALEEWHIFIEVLRNELRFPQFITGL